MTPHTATWAWSSGALNRASLIPAYSGTCITLAIHIWQLTMGLLRWLFLAIDSPFGPRSAKTTLRCCVIFRRKWWKRQHVSIFSSSQVTVMAEGGWRRSFAQIVVGFSTAGSSALPNDDRSFFKILTTRAMTNRPTPLRSWPCRSRLRSTRRRIWTRRQRYSQHKPSPPEDRANIRNPVASRRPVLLKRYRREWTRAAVVPMSTVSRTNLSQDTLLTARNTALAMTNEELHCYVAGKLDVFRRRGAVTSHHGSIAQRMQRGERSGPLMKWMVTKCAR